MGIEEEDQVTILIHCGSRGFKAPGLQRLFENFLKIK